jgi:hypothetical protein
MSSSSDSTTPNADAAQNDDSLPMPEIVMINPNFSFNGAELKVAAALKKLPKLSAEYHKDLVNLIAEGKTVDDAVRIIKRKIQDQPKGPGE